MLTNFFESLARMHVQCTYGSMHNLSENHRFHRRLRHAFPKCRTQLRSGKCIRSDKGVSLAFTKIQNHPLLPQMSYIRLDGQMLPMSQRYFLPHPDFRRCLKQFSSQLKKTMQKKMCRSHSSVLIFSPSFLLSNRVQLCRRHKELMQHLKWMWFTQSSGEKSNEEVCV